MDTEQITQPFFPFLQQVIEQPPLRKAITAAWRCAETTLIPMLCEQNQLSETDSHAIDQLAYQLADGVRKQKPQFNLRGMVQGLLQEYSLSSREGIALMCLAEALLRIPDNATRDLLIKEKISQGKWHTRQDRHASLFVNAAAWGLLLTGKMVKQESDAQRSSRLKKVVQTAGEPVVRKSVEVAIGLLGSQFVAGDNIGKALKHAARYEAKGFCYSYDMLGEAALTSTDVNYYLADYQQAILTIGKAARQKDLYSRPGISIKLSALHPRYCRAQRERVLLELYPRLVALARLAHQYNIGLNIDAEESERLDLSLDLLEKLCLEPDLAGWNGIGFVVQAYQKRALPVLDYLIDLAKRSDHRLMIRLVKGAYWDSEIKRAQVEGQTDYPVYTRKIYTDISYLACARRLLAEPLAVYPQFATHNSNTIASIYQLAGPDNYHTGQYEFQCLHGMGEILYQQVVGGQLTSKKGQGALNRPCRIYAPVGSYQTLLAYLVRRLLENGANSSFVHQIADDSIPLATLVAAPLKQVQLLAEQEGKMGGSHPQIPLPYWLYGNQRRNSCGLDLSSEQELAALAQQLRNSADQHWQAAPIINGEWQQTTGYTSIYNPADRRDKVGAVYSATSSEIEQALNHAVQGVAQWSAVPVVERAARLYQAADQLEAQRAILIGLLVRESGKTYNNAVAEIREAVDFLRYYAGQAERDFNTEDYLPLGPVLCISPWNFPLAIFTGQIAAALVAGNSVLAKPAEQTPLIAAQMVQLFLQCGIPGNVLQLLPGEGESIGAALVADSRVSGVLFTGSEAVAKQLQQVLSRRLGSHGMPVPLIAETGGLNAMLVDSSALTEQAVEDIIVSAFDSAGQRCSALRLLCIQEEAAERTLEMLKGAMQEYSLGNPERLSTDIGPIIDLNARERIEQYIEQMRQRGHRITQGDRVTYSDELAYGEFIKPTLIELASADELQQEIFGPVLHVVRYSRTGLSALIKQINASGYGLTMGVHSRIDQRINQVIDSGLAGNIYVNRNIIGAVVGVQPFGGIGKSGTGAKAGGPLYLYRLLSRYPAVRTLPGVLCQAQESLSENLPGQALLQWAQNNGRQALAGQVREYMLQSLSGHHYELAGPTGEYNSYRLQPRKKVFAIADSEQDLLLQLAAILAVRSQVLWQERPMQRALWQQLPPAVQHCINFATAVIESRVAYDALLVHGEQSRWQQVAQQAAKRKGAIIPVQAYSVGCKQIMLEWLLQEQSISVNSVAAGGNTPLMMIEP